MQRQNARLRINRLPEHLAEHNEIKDPAVVQVTADRFLMFASIGSSMTQRWLVGRFEANAIDGVWQELPPATFEGISGPQLCAPAITYEENAHGGVFTMYVQTACFEENGVIAVATSTDGQHFIGQEQPVATRESVIDAPAPVVGVYDVAVSDIKLPDQDLICMLYSGYRRVGCGDVYLSYRSRSDASATWSPGQCILSQENVPFHNKPDSDQFEWGLEGAKLIQLADDCFVMIGVCFLPKPHEYLGSRQRVFLAAATSMQGPFVALGLPFMPRREPEQGVISDLGAGNENRTGENGHPDTFIDGQNLWVMYQERDGNNQPWYLRLASIDLLQLEAFVRAALDENDSQTAIEAAADAASEQRGKRMPSAAVFRQLANSDDPDRYHLEMMLAGS